MRIIAGDLRGRSLRAPAGAGTRPSADRTRETLFNILSHAPWSPGLAGARVIDLFAGSGALGLEALSRGAAFALFVETDEAARGAIRANIEALGLFASTRVHRRSALDLGLRPAGLGAPFTLAFLDPPYRKNLVPPALAALLSGQWLTPDALIVVEHASDETLGELPGLAPLDQRNCGAASLIFLKPTA